MKISAKDQLPIVHVPAQVLRTPAQPIALDDLEELRRITTALYATLTLQRKPRGVGVALPQVGQSLRAFATLLDENEESPVDNGSAHQKLCKDPFRIYFNPSIIKHSDKRVFGVDGEEPMLEGCLSIPKLYGPVPRFEKIKIHAWTIDLTSKDAPRILEIEEHLADFPARVFQHELDHLDGILFTDVIQELELPLYRQIMGEMIQIDRSIITWGKDTI